MINGSALRQSEIEAKPPSPGPPAGPPPQLDREVSAAARVWMGLLVIEEAPQPKLIRMILE